MSQGSLVLVEDDPGDALLVEEMLLDVAPNVRLVRFSTLQAALDAWPDDADCVLLDLGLPDAVGLTAVEKLRGQLPDVPVVVLTGRTDDGIGPEALAAGAQDFLVKGQVDGPGLERSVRYAVERGRALTYQRELVAAELRAQVALDGAYKLSIAFAWTLMGYGLGQFGADWIAGKEVPRVVVGKGVQLGTASAVAEFRQASADPASVFEDRERYEEYLPMYGNVSHATRTTYWTTPVDPPASPR